MVAGVPALPTTTRIPPGGCAMAPFTSENIEIGYTLPKEFVTKTFIKSLRFYVSGNNLLTFSSFKLWDPEKPKAHQMAQAIR